MPRAESAAPLGTPVLRSPLLSALKELAASRTLRLEPDVPLRVAVVAVERYLAPHAGAGPLGPGDSYAYDLTVTDGISRVKCHLRPGLNRLVHTLSLRSGAEVRVSRLSLVHDERRLHQSFVRVEDLECCPGGESAVLSSVGSLAALLVWPADDAGNSASLQPDGPLRLGRKHYLSLWNNEDAYGPIWIRFTFRVCVFFLFTASKICLLSDLEAFFARSKRPFPLLVRVMHKSRLRYYGKPNLAIDFPYQAYFEVADQSGTMSMVLWNDLCLKWYQRLTVGAVLYLEQYSLKSSYQHRSRPQVSAHLVAFHSTEICLNPHSPTAVLSIVPPQNVKPQWRLPDVTYRFTPRTEVEHLSSNQTVDVIGLVTFVGRVERVRNRGNTIPEKYWTYRWVHALDGTSDSPFILEIFASSQPEVFDSICPMTYLVCTQMRVCREPGSALYLTSSAETQIFTTGHHRKQPYLSDPQVKAFIQWTKTLKDKLMLRRTAVGGYYCYPPPPPSFTPIALDDLKVELESLQYREHKRLAIQGHITAVRYHPWPGQITEPSQVCTCSPHASLHGSTNSLSRLVLLTKQTSIPIPPFLLCVYPSAVQLMAIEKKLRFKHMRFLNRLRLRFYPLIYLDFYSEYVLVRMILDLTQRTGQSQLS
uniref:RPA1 related single stranded DNA binding protein n=1 Tax=Denticeps clupeoides TaxID=299321 RepID=A0AAY4AJL2_9TELE